MVNAYSSSKARMCLLAVLAIAMTLTIPLEALAAGDEGTTDSEQDVVTSELVTTPVTRSITSDIRQASAAAAGPSRVTAATFNWSWTAYLTRYASGINTWTYAYQALWTSNGNAISNYQVTDYVVSKGPGWSFFNLADGGTFTYFSGSLQFNRKRTNARFGLFCTAFCVLNTYPWIEATVQGNGYAFANGSSTGG